MTQEPVAGPATLLAILQDGPDLAWIAEPGGRLLFLNREGRRLSGIAPGQDVSGLTIGDLHPFWEGTRGLEPVFTEAPQVSRWVGESTLRRIDGTLIPLHQTILLHQPMQGETEFISSIAQDRSQWVETERSLRERVKELRTLYAVSRELARTDLRLGDRIGRLVGLLSEGFLYPEITEVRIVREETDWATDGFVATDWRLRSPIRARGERVGQVVVALTEPRPEQPGGEGPFLAEERELLDGVARAIGEAVDRETWQRESFRAQRMETIGRLASGAAHDFNNLLSVIQGHAELIEGALPPGSPVRQDLSQILRATHQGSTLTSQLLSFSRTQALEEEIVHVRDLLAGLEPMVRSLIPERIDFTVELVDETNPVQVDVAKLDQAILNLVINAMDAIQGVGRIVLRGGVRRISAAKAATIPWEVTPGDYAELAVDDDGSGIPPELEGRLFEPFFTTKPEGQGTGLGLSMVYGFVKQSRGHIFIESEVGRGTTVRLILPLVHGQADVRESPAPGGAREAAPQPAARTATILVVEDDDLVRRALSRLLERDGHTVLEAPDGKAALAMVERADRDIQVVIADLVMPRMGGIELMTALRTRWPQFKVILISGYHSERELAGRSVRQATAFLRKPFSHEEVSRVVQEVLAG